MSTRVFFSSNPKPVTHPAPSEQSSPRKFCTRALTASIAAASLLAVTPAFTQVNSVGQRPYLGWSTFSDAGLDARGR